MKICINALSAQGGGGQTYLINLLNVLITSDQAIMLIVCESNYSIFSRFKSEKISIHVESFASKTVIHRVLWELLVLPKFLRDNKISKYYAPGGIMISYMPKGISSITALRNSLPFDSAERKRFSIFSYNRYKLLILKYVFLLSYKVADKVLFISNTSRDVIREFIPEIDNKSIVIPHGISSNLYKNTSDIDERLKSGEFYLYVSILDVYKCQIEVVKAWASLVKNGFEYPLVLIGPKYNKYGSQVVDFIAKNNLNDKVLYLGKIDYENIGSYYSSARALIFASSCECCPNILLEKLASGKPTLCSNIPPMPEFGGDAVLYFDPYSVESLVEKVLEIESNKELMKRLGLRALERSKIYNWEVTTRETIDFILD